MLKYKDFWVLFVLLLISGVVSCILGPATNEFDVHNYHIYAPWAFLNDRIGYDILPCGIRSYFNPILDIPYWLMIKFFNNKPLLVTFLQGFYSGLLLFFTYKLSSLISEKNTKFDLFSVLLTAFSPVVIWQWGSLYNDVQVGVLILVGLYFYLKTLFDEDSSFRTKNIIIAMCCFGAVSGLKLTSNLMIFGVFVASLIMIKFIDKPLKTFLISVITFVFSLILVNGYWYYKIYSVFGNPFFPYFNHIFKSPIGADAMIADETYSQVLPKTLLQKIFYPFLFLDTNGRSGFGSWLFGYVDLRYPIITICTFVLSIYLFLKKKANDFTNENKIVTFLLLFLLTTYLVWLNFSSIIRYVIPLIIVSCILINYTILKLTEFFKNKNRAYLCFILITFIVLQFTTKANYRIIRNSFSEKIFNIQSSFIEDDSLVLLASQRMSLVIPFLNSKAKYAMLFRPYEFEITKDNASFTYNTRTVDYYWSEYYQTALKTEIQKAKKLYLIYINSFKKEIMQYNLALEYYTENNDLKYNNCQNIYKNIFICEVNRSVK